MKSGDITLNWACEQCHTQSVQPLTDIAEVGTAICEVCGDDMVLDGDVTVKNTARVLIQVMGGVADYLADGDVDIELIDYDNDQDAPTPERFMDLCPEKFAGRNPLSARPPATAPKGGA